MDEKNADVLPGGVGSWAGITKKVSTFNVDA
jgi:hypothetical protein